MLGRKFVFLVAKTLVIAVAAFVAGTFAVIVWTLTGKQLAPAAFVGWIVLMAFVAALVPVIAWAYRRFDPSLHTPA